jgi:hypothetical protein
MINAEMVNLHSRIPQVRFIGQIAVRKGHIPYTQNWVKYKRRKSVNARRALLTPRRIAFYSAISTPYQAFRFNAL